MTVLNYPLFDGEQVLEGAEVAIEGGRITSVRACSPEKCGSGFLMPALLDAHAHMETMEQAESMLKSGIGAVCDVAASRELIRASGQLRIISSAGMAMGMVLHPARFVDRMAADGARYIKVLLFSTFSIGKPALCGIVNAAHAKGLKVAVHATQAATVRQAVDAGADILLHVPMKEDFPPDLARRIADSGMVCAPTLVMMETFADSGRNGYLPGHYRNAENAVRLLHESGAEILAATDANSGSFAPAVSFGPSLHREMELLEKAGLSPVDVLAGATSRTADCFGIERTGRIRSGGRADLLLLDGRPDRTITDSAKVRQLWIDGKPILQNGKEGAS